MKTIAAALLALTLFQTTKEDVIVDLKDGYSRLETGEFAVEFPTGWDVMPRNEAGERKIMPKDRTGEITIRVLPSSTDSWEQIYDKHLFDITEKVGGKSSGMRLRKEASGMESMAYELIDGGGFGKRKFMIVKDRDGRMLSMGMTVPTREDLKLWSEHFTRFTKTARLANK
ncbi:MAG: hypothetical protein HONBIEJF_01766 [Fimbriimonadaceae bacterium]|nr:hypothetical protein [Fimbriimonadaceae bacterium]